MSAPRLARAAAKVLKGHKARVPGMVSPGSRGVKRQAEAEGLHQIFLDAGLEWREPGCSMCNGSNGELVAPGERCASTTNRNFEGRQGRGALTHIMSPAMVAAAAVHGRLSDEGMSYMDEKVNEWLDAHPEIEVKLVTTAIGPYEGKIKEPALVMNVTEGVPCTSPPSPNTIRCSPSSRPISGRRQPSAAASRRASPVRAARRPARRATSCWAPSS